MKAEIAYKNTLKLLVTRGIEPSRAEKVSTVFVAEIPECETVGDCLNIIQRLAQLFPGDEREIAMDLGYAFGLWTMQGGSAKR